MYIDLRANLILANVAAFTNNPASPRPRIYAEIVVVTNDEIYVKDLETLFLNSMFLFKYKKTITPGSPPNILTSCAKCSSSAGALPAARKELVRY